MLHTKLHKIKTCKCVILLKFHPKGICKHQYYNVVGLVYDNFTWIIANTDYAAARVYTNKSLKKGDNAIITYTCYFILNT